MRNIIIPLILLLFFSGNCTSNYPQSQKTLEAAKRLNQINEILDEISTDSYKFSIRFGSSLTTVFGLKQMEGLFLEKNHPLMQNSEIALPLMFERLDSKKLNKDSCALDIYFVIFGKTKSAESIPYIINYLTFMSDEEAQYPASQSALWAAQEITQHLGLIDKNRSLYDQRSDIAQKLRQWYEDYKKRSLESK